jgi:hypothetical protein
MKKKLAMALMTATMGLTLMTGSVGAAHLTGLTKADCMNGGFAEYQTVRGDQSTTFKNQGQCIQFVNTGK